MDTRHEPVRDCPLCGEIMHIRTLEIVDRIPGTAEAKQRRVDEWVCPECDYFEEVEKEKGAS